MNANKWIRRCHEFHEQCIEYRKTGETEQACEIVAGFNVGQKLGWTNKKLAIVLNRYTARRDVKHDYLRDRLDVIWELDAECERLQGNNRKEIYWLTGLASEYSADDKCAPLILIRIQAAINVAFKKTFEATRRTTFAFDTETFEQRAVLQFRVPGQEASNSMNHLLNQSSVYRTRLNRVVVRRATLCPGIERPLSNAEKERIIGAMIETGEGRNFVKAVSMNICRRKNGAGYGSLFDIEEDIWGRALEYFDDQCWLTLDHFIAVERGWGVLGNEEDIRSHIVALKCRW